MPSEFRFLTENISVAAQLDGDDFARAAAAGFRTIVNNRPDHEDPGQPTAQECQAMARAQGLDYVHLPVVGPTLMQNIGAFAQILRDHPGPVLAHCRSGTRSCTLWAFAEAADGTLPADAIVERAAANGYDIAPYQGILAQAVANRGTR